MADELCFSSTCTFNFNFYDLSLLCSFIFSHPLYFSYFVFFSPYLIKFIFFVSPLFFTTTLLLLLSFLATTLPQPKLGFVQTIIDKLRSKLNDVDDDELAFRDFEDFEIYKIVFHDPPLISEGDENDDLVKQESVMEDAVAVGVAVAEGEKTEDLLEFSKFEDFEIYKIVFHDPPLITVENDDLVKLASVTDDAVAVSVKVTKGDKTEEEKSLERLFEELDRFEDSKSVIEAIDDETSPDLENLVGEIRKSEPVVVMKKVESVSSDNRKTTETSFSVKSNSWRLDSSSSFESYGSMRKEKEWKRTLACKLFEERHNSEGGEEGMDSLWESYEDDNSTRKLKNYKKESTISKKKTLTKNKKSSEFKYLNHVDDDDDEEDEDDDEFMGNGQLCCLKALKLSAGKMSLGMGKPNLVKISKALKGFGWLHHVGSKHGKRI